MASQRAWLQWVDSAGNTRITRYDADTLTAGAVRIALQSSSKGGLIAATTSSPGGPYTSPSAGDYPAVTDTLQMVMADGLGGQFNVLVPAPNANLFLLDSITGGGPFFAALSAVLVNGVNNPANGLPAQTVIAGIRTGRTRAPS